MLQTHSVNSTIDQALAQIDQIEALVVNSLHIPMTSKAVIDEEDLFELLDQLRALLPAELTQAQQVLQNQANILQDARQNAEKLLEATKEKSRLFLQEHELVKQAQKMAQELRASAEEESRRQRYDADKYSAEVLADLEQKVEKALALVQSGRQNLAQNIENTAQKMGL